MLSVSFLPPLVSLSPSLPASLLAGLNHRHVCPLCASVQASSHGDGASRADISPQASDVHDASTDLSLTPQSTDIIKVGHIPASRLFIAMYGMSRISMQAISRLEVEREGDVHLLSCLLSVIYDSFSLAAGFFFFRPFHLVGVLLWHHLVLSGCCHREGPHQHYSPHSFPSQGSPFFPTHPASNDTPQITRVHMLRRIQYTSKKQNRRSSMKKVHTNGKPQHPPRWKIESRSFCPRKLTDKRSEKLNENVPILGGGVGNVWFSNKHMQIKPTPGSLNKTWA